LSLKDSVEEAMKAIGTKILVKFKEISYKYPLFFGIFQTEQILHYQEIVIDYFKYYVQGDFDEFDFSNSDLNKWTVGLYLHLCVEYLKLE
jgi:hypothetical protein